MEIKHFIGCWMLGFGYLMPKNDKENLEILRHSKAHILASAVLEMFPEAKFGIGPAIENGFTMILTSHEL